MASPSPRHAGTVLGGRYVLERRLGSGSLGTVYLALDQQSRRQVALKLIRGEKLTPGAVADVQREFQTFTLLRHPQIAAALDFGYLVPIARSASSLERLADAEVISRHRRRREAVYQLPVALAANRLLCGMPAREVRLVHERAAAHRAVCKPGTTRSLLAAAADPSPVERSGCGPRGGKRAPGALPPSCKARLSFPREAFGFSARSSGSRSTT